MNRFLEDVLEGNNNSATAYDEAAHLLSQYGSEEDKLVIQDRLDQCRRTLAKQGEKVDRDLPGLEAEMMESLITGKNWQMDEVEINRIEEGCISDDCRDRVKSLKYYAQTSAR